MAEYGIDRRLALWQLDHIRIRLEETFGTSRVDECGSRAYHSLQPKQTVANSDQSPVSYIL